MATREVTAGLAAAVVAAGPPPAPRLAAPWSVQSPDPVLVSRWMREPHVEAFWQAAWPAERWAGEIAGQLAGVHSRPYLISRLGAPFAYVEIYRTPRDVVGRCYPAGPYDLGLHLAIGDVGQTGKGLGRAMVRAVAGGLFAADPRCARVLADPDERHAVARRMFAAAGFRPLGIHDLGHKQAELLSYEQADTRRNYP